MRPRVLLAMVTLLGCVVVSPTEASPAGTLTVQGSATAWTAFDLPADVAMEVRRATVTTSGRFGGFYLDRGGSDGGTGAVRLREFHGVGDEPHVQQLGGEEPIRKGRYRIYLIADGPTTVRVPVRGMTSRTVRPIRATQAPRFTIQPLVPNALSVQGRQPLSAAPRSLSFSSILLDDVQVFAGTLAACLTEPGGVCDNGDYDHERAGWYVQPYGAYPFIYTVLYTAGMKVGRFDAVQEAQNLTGVKYAAGASFTLTLA